MGKFPEKEYWKPTFLEVLIVGFVVVSILFFVGSIFFTNTPEEIMAPAPAPAPFTA